MKLSKCVCGGRLAETVVEKNGVRMAAQKCARCGETYISGSEMLRYDMIKGNYIVNQVKIQDMLHEESEILQY